MKTAMPQKPPETALWARRIFSAPMAAKTGDLKNATAFRRFAKQVRVAPAVKLAVYAFLISFKRSGMPKRPANKPNRSRCCFFKPVRMAAS